LSESGGDQEGPELKGERSDRPAQGGEVVLVVSGDLLDQAVATEALEDAGDLGCGIRGEETAKTTVSEARGVELTVQ
jgi:hypothetical protein